MVFSSITFLFFFLPLTVMGYFLSPRAIRLGWLLFMSLLFYGWSSPQHLLVMLGSITGNYVIGLWIHRERSFGRGGLALTAGIALNLALLGYFKYGTFALVQASEIASIFNLGTLKILEIALPVGISFYTFQALSYLIDLYRGAIVVQRNPLLLALYITFFPQLIAGPIVRYIDIADDLKHPKLSAENFVSGAVRFIVGLAKKVILANGCAEIADAIFGSEVRGLTAPLAWIGVLAYFFQIYFDFSAYSDMAIGLGRMFGFRFLENFNYPYIAQSITDFWRRWHMSLSTWFRDYLYIPLGGNRDGPWRTYRNLLIVFFLCGLWHGAGWTFIVWGLFHGVLLILERCGGLLLLGRSPRPLRHLYVWGLVMVGWVFFRADSLGSALSFLEVMAGAAPTAPRVLSLTQLMSNDRIVVLLLAFIGVTPWPRNLATEVWRWGTRAWGWCGSSPSWPEIRVARDRSGIGAIVKSTLVISVGTVTIALLFLISVMRLAAGAYNPFIYYRF